MSFEPHIKTLNKALELNVFTYALVAETRLSTVYRLVTQDGSFALRLAEAGEGGPRFELDAGVRERLGAGSPQILKTSSSHKVAGVPFWSLDAWCDGKQPERGNIPAPVSRMLGELLLRLHALPCKGYGRLKDNRDELTGEADTLQAGLESRFQEPFIFDSDWREHPVARAAPALLSQLSGREPEVRALLDSAAAPDAPRSVLHSDLHEGQILIHEGKLAALLDFGDATAGPPALDLASFAYFHGVDALGDLLAGYGDTPELRHHIDLYTLLIALHHISHAYILERPSRRSFAVQRIKAIFKRFDAQKV